MANSSSRRTVVLPEQHLDFFIVIHSLIALHPVHSICDEAKCLQVTFECFH